MINIWLVLRNCPLQPINFRFHQTVQRIISQHGVNFSNFEAGGLNENLVMSTNGNDMNGVWCPKERLFFTCLNNCHVTFFTRSACNSIVMIPANIVTSSISLISTRCVGNSPPISRTCGNSLAPCFTYPPVTVCYGKWPIDIVALAMTVTVIFQFANG